MHPIPSQPSSYAFLLVGVAEGEVVGHPLPVVEGEQDGRPASMESSLPRSPPSAHPHLTPYLLIAPCYVPYFS